MFAGGGDQAGWYVGGGGPVQMQVRRVHVRERDAFDTGNSDDVAALYSFNTDIVQHNGFTRNTSAIERSLRQDNGEWPEQQPPYLVVVDKDAYRSLPGRIPLYRAALSLAEEDLEGTVTQAREAMSLAPPNDALTRASASALRGLA